MFWQKSQNFVFVRRLFRVVEVRRRVASLPVIIPTSAVPIHLFTHDIEAEALKQLTVLAESGIVKGFVAAMADVHVGEKNRSNGIFVLKWKNQVSERRSERFSPRRPTSVRTPWARISAAE